MFGTIRKHQSWLWFIIIGVMIWSMATFVQMSKNGNGQRGGVRGEIDGKPVTDTEFQNAWNETSINYYRTHGEFPDTAAPRNGWNQEQQTYQWLLLTRKLDEYNIHVDSDSAAKFGSLILRELGRGEIIPFDQFESQVLQRHNLTGDDFQRFLEHFLGIQQLAQVVGASGNLVPPEEIKALYIQEHQEVKAQVVKFSASNYLATIPEPSPAMLGQFYTNQLSEYREPDRLQVSYVRFNITNFLADAEQKIGTNINNLVEENFARAGTNILTLGKTEAEQKTKLRELIIRSVAITNVYNVALPFQKELMAKDPVRPDNLNTLAKEKGLEVNTTKPFDKEYGAGELQDARVDVTAPDLFNLTPEDPFTYKPLRAEDGYYVLAFNKFIPSRVPPLEEIRSRVVADFKEFEAMRTAQMNARMFEATATNGLARGQTFAEIAAAAKVKPVDLPPFSVSTENLPEVEDEVDLNSFKQSVITTQAGKVSGFIPTRSGAMVVYVRERLPVDPAKMEADLPNFSKLVRQAREGEAFNMWLNKEYGPIGQALQRQQQQQGKS